MKKSKQLHAGTIRAYDTQTVKYSVLFENSRTVEWELEQVCKMWGKGKNQQQWSQVDQEALGCLVLWVHDHVVSSTSHTLCTPFPTLLSSSVWTDTQTWYTCSVTWSLPPDIKNMLSIMGKAQDAKIAETMLTAENSLLSAKRHMGQMVDVDVIEQIRMDCTGCRTALACQWHYSPHGSESASRRVPSSRRHQRDISW